MEGYVYFITPFPDNTVITSLTESVFGMLNKHSSIISNVKATFGIKQLSVNSEVKFGLLTYCKCRRFLIFLNATVSNTNLTYFKVPLQVLFQES